MTQSDALPITGPITGPDDKRDQGAVLLLVLAVAIILSLVVLALTNFVAADLRYSQVVASRAKTLSSAESGIEYAIGRMRLNQTLCSSDLADVGPIGLSGAAAPTVLPGSLNGTATTITCELMSGDFPAVAGWSVIATLGGSQAIKVDVDADADIVGPIYVSNAGNINVFSPSRLMSGDGDVWYRAGTACSTPGALSNRVVFDEPFARGPICTTATWNQIVSAPPLPPDLASLPTNDGTMFTPGPCRVFSPGRFTAPPDLDTPDVPLGSPPTDVYFESGNYVFDDGVEEWLIDGGSHVSAGHPGPLSAPSDACDDARDDDLNLGGPGATFYFGSDSRLRLDDGGSLEMFARQQGDFFVSIQALPSSNPGVDRSLVRTRPMSSVHLVVRGLVWSPTSRIVLDNPHNSTLQQLLGGVVAYQLWIGDTASGAPATAPDMVRPASAAADASVRLRSTSTMDGVSTTVEAMVAYRPGEADLDQRVRITSMRVVD